MRKGTESHIWSNLKRELDKLQWHKQRLEDKITLGIPDVNIHIPNFGDVWVELKYVELRELHARARVKLTLRKEQYIWMLQAARAGRRVVLLAKINDQWWAWYDAGAWALARQSQEWAVLERLGVRYNGPGDFLAALPSLLAKSTPNLFRRG